MKRFSVASRAILLAATFLLSGAATAQQVYAVRFGTIYSVVPSEGDVAGVKGAIVGATGPVVGWANDLVGGETALTSDQIVAKLKDYQNQANVNGREFRVTDFVKYAHLGEPLSPAALIKKKAAIAASADLVTIAYGFNRPPDDVYMTFALTEKASCVMPLRNCGAGGQYLSMSEYDSFDLTQRTDLPALTGRVTSYYLWDHNPIIRDKRLGSFDVDPVDSLNKGWRVVAVEGGASTGSSLYLMEYCVITKEDYKAHEANKTYCGK